MGIVRLLRGAFANKIGRMGKKGMGKWQEKGEGTGTVEILGQNMR